MIISVQIYWDVPRILHLFILGALQWAWGFSNLLIWFPIPSHVWKHNMVLGFHLYSSLPSNHKNSQKQLFSTVIYQLLTNPYVIEAQNILRHQRCICSYPIYPYHVQILQNLERLTVVLTSYSQLQQPQIWPRSSLTPSMNWNRLGHLSFVIHKRLEVRRARVTAINFTLPQRDQVEDNCLLLVF